MIAVPLALMYEVRDQLKRAADEQRRDRDAMRSRGYVRMRDDLLPYSDTLRSVLESLGDEEKTPVPNIRTSDTEPGMPAVTEYPAPASKRDPRRE